MAQKKLLFVLIFILIQAAPSQAEDRFEFKKEELNFANELLEASRDMSKEATYTKWLELQDMQMDTIVDPATSRSFNINEEGNVANHNMSLKIFVSFSMSNDLLKTYLKQAKLYRGVLVFKGLPNGSWRELSQRISEIVGNKVAGSQLQIDDISFEEYAITSVPTIVLVQDTRGLPFSGDDRDQSKLIYDKVSGNIGVRKALEIIREEGELSNEAESFLANQEVEDGNTN